MPNSRTYLRTYVYATRCRIKVGSLHSSMVTVPREDGRIRENVGLQRFTVRT